MHRLCIYLISIDLLSRGQEKRYVTAHTAKSPGRFEMLAVKRLTDIS